MRDIWVVPSLLGRWGKMELERELATLELEKIFSLLILCVN